MFLLAIMEQFWCTARRVQEKHIQSVAKRKERRGLSQERLNTFLTVRKQTQIMSTRFPSVTFKFTWNKFVHCSRIIFLHKLQDFGPIQS